MKKFLFVSLALFGLLAVFALTRQAFANTPGKHSVVLSWTASTTTGVTYNLYRGTGTGTCSGTPTPYVTGISGTTFTDTTPLSGTSFYNVSAVGTTGESACAGEISVTVPNITTVPPSGLAGSVQ